MVVKSFFFSKIKLNQILINKYAIQHFYNKYFITKLFFNKWKRLILVDNYSNQSLVLSTAYQSLFLVNLVKRGCSLVADYFTYKNSKLYNFLYNGLGVKSKITNFVTKISKRLSFCSNKKEFFILYKIKRGGYSGFTNGLKGFIPLTHLLFSRYFFKTQFNCIFFYNVSNTNFLLSNFQNLKLVGGGFNFNFKMRKRNRLFLSGKLKFFFYFYFILINNLLNRFKSFRKEFRQRNIVFKYFFKNLIL